MEPANAADDLRERIKVANHEYYTLAQPTLTDTEYDALVKQYKVLVPDDVEIFQQVGEKATTGAKIKHRRQMLSLDNVFTPEEVTSFFSATDALIWEPKVDGLSLSITYRDGKLVQAVTRGDGREGDDVTHNARVIPSIPQTIPSKEEVEVRGEVYISKGDFRALLAELEAAGEEPFANARNAAAGSLKLKDSAEAKQRKLSFLAYHVFGLEGETQTALREALVANGFMVPYGEELSVLGQATFDRLNVVRKELVYDTDGIVLKVNDVARQQELGTGTRAPKWAVAYKFPPEEGIATLLGVQLQVGRTGTINPVALVSPTLLNGATVNRATLCNYDEIRRLNIAVGDQVVVVRAAEVIPKILRRHAPGTNRTLIFAPTHCPSCASPLVKDDALVAYRCVNKTGCAAQAVQRLSHAVSKACLDWDGFGMSQVNLFVGRGYGALSTVMAVRDISFLKPAAQKKFLSERERVKTVPLWRKLHALGIEGVGKSLCQDLAFRYTSLVAIVNDIANVVDLLGPTRGMRFFMQLETLADEIDDLALVGFKFEEEKREVAVTSATGKIFVITGSLTTGGRDEVAEKIVQAGGVVKSSVTKATNYLVVGESPGANKTAAAAKHGTKLLSEEDLYALIGQDFKVASNPLDTVNMDEL